MEKAALSRFLNPVLQLGIRHVISGILFLSGIALLVVFAPAQTPRPMNLQSKIFLIEQELQPHFGPVRLHRLESLEDDVFTPTFGSTNVESPFLVYQVVQRRFFVKAGEVVQSIPAREFSMYVAISQDGEKVYRFAGFPDSEGDFKRLVSDFQIQAPQSRDAAQSRALYCARVVFGEEPSRWVLSEIQARELVSDRLFDHRKDAFSQTARWWQNYRRIHPDSNLNLTTTKTADGAFLTRLPLFWAPIESDVQPELRELQIVVNKDGSCRRVAHP